MFRNISVQIIDTLIESNTIKTEDKEIYLFGIQQMFTILLNAVTVVFLGILTKMLLQSVLFMTAFIPLRIYAGGFHSKTPLRCYIYSTCFLAVILLAMRFINVSFLIYCVLYIISSIIILWLSPAEDKNKPLDELEKSVYKKRTIMFWIIESLIGSGHLANIMV